MKFLLLLFILSISITSSLSDKLIFLQVVWRHGDRAPVNTYPTDIYGEDVWPYGYGELTELGMSQHVNLGKLLRRNYILNSEPLLSRKYNPKEIYIRSTDVNRTLLSAISNTVGMYPAGEAGVDYPNDDRWPSHFTPIPIHTVSYDSDHVGNMQAECPRAGELAQEIKKSRQYKQIEADYQKFFQYAKKYTGKQYDLSNIYELFDVYYVETIYNLTQPKWMTEEFIETLKNVTFLANDFYYGISSPYKPELIRLRGGNILKSIINNIDQKIECLNSDTDSCRWMKNLKYYAYSAHDTTVAALLTTFGDEQKVLKGGLPKYTASVAVELWHLDDIGYAVKILFHQGFHHPYRPITRRTHGCPANSDFCPFDKFVQRSKKFIPNNIEEECRPKMKNSTKSRFQNIKK